MTDDDAIELSKFLSFVLRHRPDAIRLSLDEAGWAPIDELVRAANAAGRPLTRVDLLYVVATSDKQRFSLSPDGQSIRAAQGHSIPIALDLPPREPPELLYHGTATRFLASIRTEGLKPGARQHVHLSREPATAYLVGKRHGAPVVLTIAAGRMHAQGFTFYLSDNGVWLTSRVPPELIRLNP